MAPTLEIEATGGKLEVHAELRVAGASTETPPRLASGGDLILAGQVRASDHLVLDAGGRIVASTALPSASELAARRHVGDDAFFTATLVPGGVDASVVGATVDCEDGGFFQGVDLPDSFRALLLLDAASLSFDLFFRGINFDRDFAPSVS